MLESLNISNYALIDKVEIEFHPGLNIITGETGAGKSIMLGALNLLLGGRADSKAVRHADTKSVIEVSFTVDDYQSLKQFCLDNDIEWDDERCILRREISPTGRSRAFINDSPVPLSRLEAVGCRLIDIHSQHQNQLLAREDFQLQVIDSLAGNSELLNVHATRFEAFRRALHAYKVTKARLKKTRDDEEYTRYQLDQLNDLRLGDPNEQTELEQRREVLENLTAIKSELNTVLDSLFSGSHNAIDLIAAAQASCEELASLLPPDEQIVKRLEAAYIDLKDIAETVSAVDSSLMADPAELDDIERRLSDIYAMEQRHKVDSTAELIELRDKLAARLDALDGADETLASLEKEARRARDLAKESAAELTASRIKAAEALAAELVEKARPLGMKNLVCEIAVQPADLSARGADSVDMRFAFNKNQTPVPVSGAASGGEISRLMLTLKSIIARRMELPAIIFDEVDTGVSGDVALRMGRMMAEISRSLQVIAITHLPQVAAMGAHHYKVYKTDTDLSTHTAVEALSPERRVDELALMLSGNPDDEAARGVARALLNNTPS